MPTALITGASRGIGRTTAKLFAESGWDLLLVARREDSLNLLKKELVASGATVYFKSIDLSNPDEIIPGISELLECGLSPSVLINNAGVAWTGELLNMPLSSWQWIFQMNLTSVFQICSAVVPQMREKGGLVINVSSHAANNSFPKWGGYCISKAALASFTKCLAEEERINSIRACTLTLGAVNTSLWDSETVQSDFNREAMLSAEKAAKTLLYLAMQPLDQVIEDLVLMPVGGAF